MILDVTSPLLGLYGHYTRVHIGKDSIKYLLIIPIDSRYKKISFFVDMTDVNLCHLQLNEEWNFYYLYED